MGINRAYRQSKTVVIQAINGTKSNCPAAKAAVSIPTTKPRLFRNHLEAIVAARPSPMIPDAAPRKTPMVIKKCHFSNAMIHNPNPIISSPNAIRTTGVTPRLSISAPLKGARQASVKNIMPIALVISEICQPNSCVIGRMISCGALPIADENIVIKNTSKAITQP